MQTPNRADIAGWYSFSAQPGRPGNAVFTGHLDFAGVGTAVFARLRDVQVNDEVQVVISEATLRYRVVSSRTHDASNAPVDQIVRPTSVESVPLITLRGDLRPQVAPVRPTPRRPGRPRLIDATFPRRSALVPKPRLG